MPKTSIISQLLLWLVHLASNTCMAYQNTNSNIILQQQINVPLTHISATQFPLKSLDKDDTFKVAAEDPKLAAVNNIVKQKVPLQYNNATIELVSSGIGASANSAPPGTQYLQTPASVYLSNYNSQQNVRQLLRNIDERLRTMRNVEMRVAKIQVKIDFYPN